MKEIIELEKHELYKLLDCLPIPMVTDEDLEKEIKEGRKIVFFGKERKIEQVPETFEEVQKLCERYREKHEFEAHKDFTVIEEFAVRNDGSVWLYYENIAIQTELTPARQWQIIKNLIGEE